MLKYKDHARRIKNTLKWGYIPAIKNSFFLKSLEKITRPEVMITDCTVDGLDRCWLCGEPVSDDTTTRTCKEHENIVACVICKAPVTKKGNDVPACEKHEHLVTCSCGKRAEYRKYGYNGSFILDGRDVDDPAVSEEFICEDCLVKLYKCNWCGRYILSDGMFTEQGILCDRCVEAQKELYM